MFRKNKNLIEKIKILKSVKADEAFKFDLRKKIIEETGIVTNINFGRLQKQQDMSTLRFIINNLYKNKNMFIPLLLIAALLGGGAGATYASQSSLPGDTLYPVKLASEKVQTVLVVNDAKEADLHLKFSSKRLEEIEELAKKGNKKQELVKLAVDNYKEELTKVQEILNSAPANTSQAAQIAQNVADTVSQNKVVIARVSEKFDRNDDALDELEEAWEEATEHNDIATIALLSNSRVSTQSSSIDTIASSTNQSATSQQTTTSTAVIDLAAQAKVLNKIAETNHKIAEAEKYIAKKEQKNIDVTKAKEQIGIAKIAVNDAQDLLSQNRYSESFLKAKEAHKIAEMAKKSAEDNYKEKEHIDDDEDDEVIFIIPSITNPAPATNTSQTPNTSILPTTTDNTSSISNPTSGSGVTNTSTSTTTNNHDRDDDKDDDDNDDHDDDDNNDRDR